MAMDQPDHIIDMVIFYSVKFCLLQNKILSQKFVRFQIF